MMTVHARLQFLQHLRNEVDRVIAGLEDNWVSCEELAASLRRSKSNFSTVVFEIICNCVANKLIQKYAREVECA